MKKNSAILEPEFRIEFANVKADSAALASLRADEYWFKTGLRPAALTSLSTRR